MNRAAQPIGVFDSGIGGLSVLQALCRRHLAEVPQRQWRLFPAAPGTPGWHPGPVPAPQAGLADQWSAFVAQDLAPMFSDTPWLDIPPGGDGQAGLLAALRSATADAWQQALQVLGLAAPQDEPPAGTTAAPAAPEASLGPGPAHTTDPRQFLLAVMNDAGVPLALRIEAAKALLPVAGPR